MHCWVNSIWFQQGMIIDVRSRIVLLFMVGAHHRVNRKRWKGRDFKLATKDTGNTEREEYESPTFISDEHIVIIIVLLTVNYKIYLDIFSVFPVSSVVSHLVFLFWQSTFRGTHGELRFPISPAAAMNCNGRALALPAEVNLHRPALFGHRPQLACQGIGLDHQLPSRVVTQAFDTAIGPARNESFSPFVRTAVQWGTRFVPGKMHLVRRGTAKTARRTTANRVCFPRESANRVCCPRNPRESANRVCCPRNPYAVPGIRNQSRMLSPESRNQSRMLSPESGITESIAYAVPGIRTIWRIEVSGQSSFTDGQASWKASMSSKFSLHSLTSSQFSLGRAFK